MADSKSYHDLVVWKKGIELAKEIYILTKDFPSSELYGLTSQLRRAAVSIPSNLAEGQARTRNTREFSHFIHLALGSLAEIDTQIILANEFGYIKTEKMPYLDSSIAELRKMLYGLLNSLSH